MLSGGERESLNGELGSLELLTVFFLLLTIVLTILLSSLSQGLPRYVRIWFGLTVLGCIYFAGEEASWGQHIFGWSTAEGWSKINNQEETNLHNVHGLFDQVPRFFVGAGIFVGGLLLPVLGLCNIIKQRSGDFWQWFVPETACILVAIAVTFVRPVFELTEITFISTGEYKEYLISWFFFVYAASKLLILRRHRSAKQVGEF